MATYYSYGGTYYNSTWVAPTYQHLAIRDRHLQLSDKELEAHCIQELLKIQDLPNIFNLEEIATEAIAYFRKYGTELSIGSALSKVIKRNNQ